MTFPNMPDKHNRDSVLTAAKRMAHRRRLGTGAKFQPPHSVLLCFQPRLLQYAVKKYKGQKVDGIFGSFHLLKKAGKQLGVAGNFGVGAPAAAVVLEDLVAFGVKRFISVGTAGGLLPGAAAGDVVLASGAIRDEGTSHHYLPSKEAAVPSQRLTELLGQQMEMAGLSFRVGATWTIDAPYRETAEEINRYRSEGTLTVEMEAAALFAVAQYLGVETAAAFAVADTFGASGWGMSYDTHRTERALEQLLDAAFATLIGADTGQE